MPLMSAAPAPVRPLAADLVLSTGRTITHRRLANGAQEALVVGTANGAMTDAEWAEYVARTRA